ncbi:glycosyltransferase family 4 protein [Haladaptatus cibarius]|uniref:glycosyltransferase family 4 protein n=1 Tax=Haladaptatus cibarius TaxID=453847 RepID=UPI0006795C95|nr:glycosyltransferase family 4 protein [Haladaptatus cibarius]
MTWREANKAEEDIVLVNPAKTPRPETKMLSEQLPDDEANLSVVIPREGKGRLQPVDDVEYVFYDAWFVPGVRYPIPFPSFFVQLFNLLRRADIAFVTSYIYLPCLVTTLFSTVLRIPCVLSVDVLVGVHWSYGRAVVDSIANVYTRTVGRCTLALCDTVVVPGEYMRTELRQFVNEEKITVIPNGIDVGHFSAEPMTTEPNDCVELLYVGRLAPVKNISLLLRSVRYLQEHEETEYVLTLVGDGEDRARYESMARRLEVSDDVHFAGYQSSVRAYYRDADVLVLTSISEGFPTVLMEAQACGLPVVTTDVGGAREIVAAGAVVPRDEPDAIASAIADVVASNTATLSATARHHAETQYSQKRLCDRYKSMFRKQIRNN